MGWYKPGRDGPSRSSRPKVWAPIGRVGCLVLAVTVIVGIAIALTIVATWTAGAADRADGYAATPEPSIPSYPDDAGISFEPVGDSAWRVIEPDLDCERNPFIGARETAKGEQVANQAAMTSEDDTAALLDALLGEGSDS
jgi:hypothetical protein